MRRPLPALALLLLTLAAAACTTAAAGWTYAPPTAPPASQPAASGEASSAPTAAPTAEPSGQAPTEVPGASAGGTVVQVSALNIAFEQSSISAPAGQPFTIHFDNKDAGVPHDVAIKDQSGTMVFKGNVVTGPGQADYQVAALAAGTYTFVCTIHPNMTGTLTVGP